MGQAEKVSICAKVADYEDRIAWEEFYNNRQILGNRVNIQGDEEDEDVGQEAPREE